jgi:hypothetical protein
MRRTISQIRDAGIADGNKPWGNERFDEELAKALRVARERGPFVAREARHLLGR